MGRRKQFMDDDDDSSDEEGGRIHFDITDRDLEEEAEGFYGKRKTKGKKRFAEDLGDDDEDDDERAGLGRGGIGSGLGLPKMVHFQAAKQSPQPGSGSSSKASTPEPTKRSRHAASASAAATTTTTTAKPSEDFAKFAQHSKGVAKRMLEKMGWRPGQGLGKEGAGIVNPIETKLRPKGMGMGFRGFSEMTAQAREEAKLRGDVDSSEEENDDDDRGKTAKPSSQKREAWKRTKPKKQKQIYKTAAAIIGEQAGLPETKATTTQKLIDMRGPTVREISIQDLQRHSPSWQETTTRLPELRHNLRLIVDLARGDLENLARDRQTNKLRIKATEEEVGAIESKREIDALQRRKVLEIKAMAGELGKLTKDARATGAYEQANITALFGSVFERMLKEYTKDDIRTLHLDRVVVAVWAPIMKYKTSRWDVLEDPTWGAKDVLAWRQLLVANDDDDDDRMANDADYVIPRRQHKRETPNATPFEMMMNTIWLVRVRSAINNNWNVRDPEPMVTLLETWKPVLPRFIFENIINQLVLPKISRAVSDWDPRNDPEMIHTWIHPWLPVLESWRLGELFTTIRHKISVILRAWHPSDESALHIITPWKEIWTATQMEGFLLKSILPKLKHVLRNEFLVNPRDQKLEPLIWVMAWQSLFSETIIAQLLENEFFTKWLDVLYKWLTLNRDRVNYDEVREWYLWWRQIFETYGLDNNKIVSGCFRKGLDMMAAAANGEPVTRS